MTAKFTDYAKHVAELKERMDAINDNPEKQKEFEKLVRSRKRAALGQETIISRNADTGVFLKEGQEVNANLALMSHHSETLEELCKFYIGKAEECGNFPVTTPGAFLGFKPELEAVRGKIDAVAAAVKTLTSEKACALDSAAFLKRYNKNVGPAYNECIDAFSKLHAEMERENCLDDEDVEGFRLPDVSVGVKFEPKCNGKNMPKEMKDWYDKTDDEYAEKIAFCRLPKALETVVDAAADRMLGRTQKEFFNLFKQHTFKAGSTIKEGDVVGKYKVVHAGNGFIGLGRPKQKDEEEPEYSSPLIRLLAKLAGGFVQAARTVAKCGTYAWGILEAMMGRSLALALAAALVAGGAWYGFDEIMLYWDWISQIPGNIANVAATIWTFITQTMPEFVAAMQAHITVLLTAPNYATSTFEAAQEVAKAAANTTQVPIIETAGAAVTDEFRNLVGKTITETFANSPFGAMATKLGTEEAATLLAAVPTAAAGLTTTAIETGLCPSVATTLAAVGSLVSENLTTKVVQGIVFATVADEAARGMFEREVNSPQVEKAVTEMGATVATCTANQYANVTETAGPVAEKLKNDMENERKKNGYSSFLDYLKNAALLGVSQARPEDGGQVEQQILPPQPPPPPPPHGFMEGVVNEAGQNPGGTTRINQAAQQQVKNDDRGPEPPPNPDFVRNVIDAVSQSPAPTFTPATAKWGGTTALSDWANWRNWSPTTSGVKAVINDPWAILNSLLKRTQAEVANRVRETSATDFAYSFGYKLAQTGILAWIANNPVVTSVLNNAVNYLRELPQIGAAEQIAQPAIQIATNVAAEDLYALATGPATGVATEGDGGDA